MGLFKPAWQSKNYDKAVNAVNKISDTSVLVEIATSDTYVSSKALEKIKDPALISYIAKNAKENYTRKEAIKRVTDKSILTEIIKKEKRSAGNYESLGKQDIVFEAESRLRAIEIKYEKEQIRKRKKEINQITNQSALSDILSGDEYPEIRELAIKKITDQTILANIARKNKYYDVREEAVKKLTDQSVLVEIAWDEKEEEAICKLAVSKITDQHELLNIAKQHKNRIISFDAIKNLTDIQMIMSISDSHTRDIAPRMLELLRNTHYNSEDRADMIKNIDVLIPKLIAKKEYLFPAFIYELNDVEKTKLGIRTENRIHLEYGDNGKEIRYDITDIYYKGQKI